MKQIYLTPIDINKATIQFESTYWVVYRILGTKLYSQIMPVRESSRYFVLSRFHNRLDTTIRGIN